MCVFLSRLRPGTGRLLGWFSTFLLLWTLAPRDYVTYCQAWGLSGHTSPCGECVCFNLENSAPPKVEQDSLLSRGRTLSGHTWSTARKLSILDLSSLHPYCKHYLGYTARRWFTTARRRFTLLDDHEFDYSALFAPARTSSTQHCTTDTRRSGTSCGGHDPRYPW